MNQSNDAKAGSAAVPMRLFDVLKQERQRGGGLTRSKRKAVLVGFASFYLAVPAPALAQEIGRVSSPLAHGGSETIWPMLNIPVCWEPDSEFGSDAEQDRRWTREAIEATWEDVSNVNFVNWNTCTNASPGIRIIGEDGHPHVTDLGYKLNGREDGMSLNYTFRDKFAWCAEDREYCIKAIAVHEFGHALGFAHEHNRTDRSMCNAEPQGTDPIYYITPYDPQSIMNYCGDVWNNDGTLSPSDVAGVRMTYGPFQAETPARVEVRGTMFIKDDERGADETGSFDLSHTFVLTERAPEDQHQFSHCVGDEVRVEMDVRATLVPDSADLTVNARSRLYEGTSCSTSDLEDEDQMVFNLPVGATAEPLRLRLVNGGFGGGDYAEINMQVGRYEAPSAVSCSDCDRAADRARFASGSPRPANFATQPRRASATVPSTDVVLAPAPSEVLPAGLVCQISVQDKVAWNYKGSKHWAQSSIDKLCKGAQHSAEPGLCFNKVMHGNVSWGGGTKWSWQNAVGLCAGTLNAKTTINCFTREMKKGGGWQRAAAACRRK